MIKIVVLSRLIQALALACSVLALVAAAPAVATPAWVAPVDLSTTGQNAHFAQVAVDPQGNALAVWRRFDGDRQRVQAAVRPAGGAWEAPVDLSAAGEDAVEPQVAVEASGNAVAVWRRFNGANFIVQAAGRSAGGAWQTPADLSATGQNAYLPQIAVDPQGNAVAVWEAQQGGGPLMVQSAFRPAGGDWQAPVDLAPGHGAQVALDEQGNALAVWGGSANVQTANRPAGGAWQAPADLAPGSDPQIAVSPRGDSVAVWVRSTADGRTVQAAVRRTGGTWQAPVDLSAAGQTASNPQVAIDPQANAVAVWEGSTGGGRSTVKAAVGSASGAWEPAVDLSPKSVFGPQVAIDQLGNAIAVWQGWDGTFIVQAAVRPAAGAWQTPVELSTAGQNADSPQITFDAQGNAVAVWDRLNGSEEIVQAAGYDAAGPLLRALSIPASGTVRTPLSLSVSPLDAWSALGATSWNFGDGDEASGSSVAHTYAAAGRYNVTVTSADALSNAASATQTVTITDAPAAVGRLRVAPAEFRAARSGSSVKAASVPTGARVSYTLSTASAVRFTVERAASGRRVGDRCVKPTRTYRARKTCVRFLRVRGSFARRRPAGTDRFTFTGRLAGHVLRPSRYRLVASPIAGGRAGKPARAGFRIVK